MEVPTITKDVLGQDDQKTSALNVILDKVFIHKLPSFGGRQIKRSNIVCLLWVTKQERVTY